MDERIHEMLERWDKAAIKPTPEELCSDCPELLPELKRAILALVAADGLMNDPALGQATDLTEADPLAPKVAGYTILHHVGRGGQAVVYAALKENTGRKVAVKVLLHGAFASLQGRARFDREVAILAALNHPNIVTIIDRGVTSNGAPFIVMDFVEGRPLDKHVAALTGADNSPADPLLVSHRRQTLLLFSKICDAVHVAHERGIVHRDLKPNNILIDPRGEPHILDFGVARSSFSDPNQLPLSITDQFLGTIMWASPEQANSLDLDHRTDIYSLGLILYYMLTGGKFPYDVLGPVAQVLNNILLAQPVPPSQVLVPNPVRRDRGRMRNYLPVEPPLNPVIEEMVLKALSKKPEDRYSSAKEMAESLRTYLSGLAVRSGASTSSRRAVPWLRIGLVGLIAVIIGMLIQRYLRRGIDANQRTAPTAIAPHILQASAAAPKVSQAIPALNQPTTSEAPDASEAQNEPGVWQRFDLDEDRSLELQFLPDSRRLATFGTKGTRIWNLQTRECRSYACTDGVSPDGQYLGRIALPILDVNSGLAVNPAGLTANGRRFYLFKRKDLVTVRFDLDHETSVLPFQTAIWGFSADGRYSVGVGGKDNLIRVFNAETNEVLGTLDHRLPVYSVSYGPQISPNGELVLTPSVEDDIFSLWIWDWKRGKSSLLVEPYSKVGKDVPFARFSPDGKRVLVESHWGGIVPLTLWNVADPSTPKRLWEQSPKDPVNEFSFSPDSRGILIAKHNHARDLSMIDCETGVELYRMHDDREENTNGIGRVSVSPDGRVAASARGGGDVLTIWRLRDSTSR